MPRTPGNSSSICRVIMPHFVASRQLVASVRVFPSIEGKQTLGSTSKMGRQDPCPDQSKGGMRMRKIVRVAVAAAALMVLGGSAFAAGDAEKGKADYTTVA